MNIVKIVFSPTGGTEKVANIIVNCWGKNNSKNNIINIDLFNHNFDILGNEISPEDKVLIAMPCFCGRVPVLAIERFRQISGNGAKCTIVCVYGNRDYDDTLAEMQFIAGECGFNVIAAISAVAEHSLISEYAKDRPDKYDSEQLSDFADKIWNKNDPVGFVPGKNPNSEMGSIGLVPDISTNCIKCGKCVKECPVNAISAKSFISDKDKCISCLHCVKYCPKNARKIKDEIITSVAMAIKETCLIRKDNELFL